jgi:hypothetical protein
MTSIWYAVGLYMIGIAAILYFRPTVMFRENGMWKEFGLGAKNDKQTVFPFWMFAIVWAILSYALANMISLFLASIVLNSAVDSNAANAVEQITPFIQPISAAPAINLPPPVAPMAPMAPAAVAPKAPGYYILDPYNLGPQPKYIYYGPEPPGYSGGIVAPPS